MISSPPADAPKGLPSAELSAFKASVRSGRQGEHGRIELLCEIPAWSTECFDDLAACQDLRKRTLAALHDVLDDLRLGGLSPKYRLLTTSPIPFASIRVADYTLVLDANPSSSTNAADDDSVPRSASSSRSHSVDSSTSGGSAVSEGVFELTGKLDALGPARPNTGVLREELERMRVLDRGRFGPHALVLPSSRSTTGPTLVLT